MTPPVAADGAALAAIEEALGHERSGPLEDTRVSELFSSFKIPAAAQASLQDVVSLRLNEEAFYEFRTAFQEILLAVSDSRPGDESTFSMEFRRHAYESLVDRRRRVTQLRKSSDKLQQIPTGVFLMGASGIESSITHEAPVGSVLATAATSSAWLALYLKRKATVKKNDELTRTFFSYLAPGKD
jgi:hypothetical protein